MSIQYRSTLHAPRLSSCHGTAAGRGTSRSAAKRITRAQSSRPRRFAISAVAVLAAFGMVGCAHIAHATRAEPVHAASDSAAIHQANADALALATAAAHPAHAARELVSTARAGANATAELASTRGWITAHNLVWVPQVDAMGQHLALADDALAKKDAARAERQLDEAAGVLARDAGESSAVNALHSMARDVAQDHWPTAHAYDRLLMQANSADPHHGWGTDIPYADYVETPLRQLRRADASYATGRRFETAGALRDAASDIDRAARDATGQTRTKLLASSVGLRSLAAEIETGAAHVPSQLQHALARAAAALAQEHVTRARALWHDHAEAATGRELQAATLSLHESAHYAARNIDPEVIQQTRRLSAQLLDHAAVQAPAVEHRLSALDQQLDKIQQASSRLAS